MAPPARACATPRERARQGSPEASSWSYLGASSVQLTSAPARFFSLLAGSGGADEDARVIRGLLRTIFGLRRALRKAPAAEARPADPREQDAWVAGLLAELGDRYRLGDDKPEGAQVLRRT